MDSSRRDLLNTMAEHTPISKKITEVRTTLVLVSHPIRYSIPQNRGYVFSVNRK